LLGSSIYFRFIPYPEDWFILIFQTLLSAINQIFLRESVATAMEVVVYDHLKNRYNKTIYNLMHLKNKAKSVVIFAILIIAIYFLGKA